jgi:hypothetical protein
MKLNYYEIFRYKLYEEEKPIETESDMEKILKKSKKVTNVLARLLCTSETVNEKTKEQIRNIVSDIKCISYKPTTFRIAIKNGNYFDIKYTPSPDQNNNPDDYKPYQAFTVLVSGKSYSISNMSEYEQCLEYIQRLMKTRPLGVGNENIPSQQGDEEEPAPDEAPEDQAPPEEEPKK